MNPVRALAMLCLLLACSPAARRSDRASTSAALNEDADVPVDQQAPREVPRPFATDTAATGHDVAADPPALDQAANDELGDAPSEPDSAADAPGPPPDVAPCPGYKKGTHTQSGVAGATFCAAYAERCGYQASPAFSGVTDCLATYDGAATTARTCRAGHLCEAIVSTTTSGRLLNCQAAAHGSTCP